MCEEILVMINFKFFSVCGCFCELIDVGCFVKCGKCECKVIGKD